jgi:hypothetical protein
VDKASSLPLSKPCALTHTYAPARALISHARTHAHSHARTGAQHANSISECVFGVSTQYAYTHMGYMEE